MKKNKKEMEKFVNSIRKGYDKNTYTKDLCIVKKYSSIDQNKNFVQIPVQIDMEPEDFFGHIDNTFLGNDLGKLIACGEFMYILDQVKQKQKSGKIKGDLAQAIPNILSQLPPNFDPKFLLIPIDDEYYHQFHDLVDGRTAKYEQDGLALYWRGHKIKIIWSSRQRPFKELYLIGRDSLTWIYKNNLSMENIKNITNYRKDFDNQELRISVIFKEEGNKINFVARAVGYIEVEEGKVRVYSFD